MKKQLMTVLFSAIFCLGCFAQGLLAPVWVKSKFSSIGGKTEGWGVDVDSSGNVYWPVSSDSTGQGLDIFCYKFDANGNSLWSSPFFYGGAGTQHAFVCNAKDTALYIGGRYCALTGLSCDMQLLKVNKNSGTLIWARTKNFGNNGYDEMDGLEIQPDGIYCGGWAQALQTGSYQIDVGLWKVDFNGNTIWSNYFGKTGTAEHQDGRFVVDNNFIYGAGLWGGKSIANLYNGYSFLGKFSKTTGSFVDSSLFGNQSNAFLDIDNALGMTTDGTYLYITGYTIPVASSDWQIFTAKFDKNLNQIWYNVWGGSSTESARGIAVSNGKIYVAGLTTSPGYNPGGKADGVLLVYDTLGNFITYKTWGDTLDNSFRDIVVSGNFLYMAGSSGNNLSNGDSDSGFVMKAGINSILSSMNETEVPLFISIFPNPFSSSTTLRTDNLLKSATLSVYNLYGQTVKQIKNISGQTVTLFRDNLPGGLYFFRLTQDNKTFATDKLIITN